jgi:hypothetical protein
LRKPALAGDSDYRVHDRAPADSTSKPTAEFVGLKAGEATPEHERTLHLAPQWTPTYCPPTGRSPWLDYHIAFKSNGNFRVSEIWDSREQFDAFGQRLMPVLKEVGIEPGEPEMLEIHNIIQR